MTATPSEKMRLREQYRTARNAIFADDAANAALAIRDHFLGGIEMTANSAVAGTMPLPGEVDPIPLMQGPPRKRPPAVPPHHAKTDRRARQAIGLPRLCAGRPPSPSPPSASGNRGPRWKSLPTAIVLTPADRCRSCRQPAGAGGRILRPHHERLPRRPASAPFHPASPYAAQVVDSLPHDRFDQPLDGVVTEEGVSLFS